MSYREDMVEKTVKPTLGTIYTCSQKRKGSKTKSEEGWCTHTRKLPVLFGLYWGQKCGSKTGSKCQKVSPLKCLTFVQPVREVDPLESSIVLKAPYRLHFTKSAVHLRPLWAFSSAG